MFKGPNSIKKAAGTTHMTNQLLIIKVNQLIMRRFGCLEWNSPGSRCPGDIPQCHNCKSALPQSDCPLVHSPPWSCSISHHKGCNKHIIHILMSQLLKVTIKNCKYSCFKEELHFQSEIVADLTLGCHSRPHDKSNSTSLTARALRAQAAHQLQLHNHFLIAK